MINSELIKDSNVEQQQEIMVKTLGWLLNPSENHNINNKFLNDFLFLASGTVGDEVINVQTFYNMGEYGFIDILLETSKTIYALKCGDMDDCSNIGNLLTYKDYIEEDLKTDKSIKCIFISIAPFAFGNVSYNYIKCLRYYEIAEILPDNLDVEKQKFINHFSDLIQEKSVKYIYQNYTADDVANWKGLNKYGNIIRQLAKYFDLHFDYELFRSNYRRYAINISKDIFLIFNCEKANLKVVIKRKSNNLINTVQEVTISDIDTKSLDEIATSIKASRILENFKQLLNSEV